MKNLKCLTATVVLAGLAPCGAMAQNSTVQTVVAGWHVRQQVRVETLDGDHFFGRFLHTADESLALSAPNQPDGRAVRRDSISRLWVQNGTYAVRGAIIGAVISPLVLRFVVTSTVTGVGTSGECRDARCLAVTAGVGAVLGGIVGMFLPHWRLVYTRDSRP